MKAENECLCDLQLVFSPSVHPPPMPNSFDNMSALRKHATSANMRYRKVRNSEKDTEKDTDNDTSKLNCSLKGGQRVKFQHYNFNNSLAFQCSFGVVFYCALAVWTTIPCSCAQSYDEIDPFSREWFSSGSEGGSIFIYSIGATSVLVFFAVVSNRTVSTRCRCPFAFGFVCVCVCVCV